MKVLHWPKQLFYNLKLIFRMVFSYPNPRGLTGEGDYDRYWEEKRHENVPVLSDWQKERALIISQILERQSGSEKFVLGDIGCGDGAILHYLNKEGLVRAMMGYDTSTRALERAKSVGIQIEHIDLEREGDLSKLKEVDYYLLLEVLEHLKLAEKVLKNAFDRSLKGVFLSVPNSGYFPYRLRLLFGKFPVQWVTHPDEHVRFWTGADMEWWLRSQGYTKYNLCYYRGVALLNRIFPRLFAAGMLVYLKKENL